MTSIRLGIGAIYLYLWSLTVHPQNRFPFLATIQSEKILIVLAVVFLVSSSNFRIRFSIPVVLYLFLFFWMFICLLVSPYKNYFHTQWWIENYWKFVVVLLIIFWGTQDLSSLIYLIKGYTVMLLLYQVHSWADFLMGGSYVYQQGMKRIIGIWSGGGIGAANAFALVSLFTLPFTFFWFKYCESKWQKRLLFCGILICFASIIFSGTRGALICGIIFLIINTNKPSKVFGIGIIILLSAFVLMRFLPPDLKYRYFHYFTKESVEIDERFSDLQEESMQARIDGLVDGWHLALLSPITGFGPGSSSIARLKLNRNVVLDDGTFLQLHNLYGQIFSETGFIGTFIIVILLFFYFRQLSAVKPFCTKNMLLLNKTIRNAMIIWLLYGMVSHTLYRYNWALLLALQGSFMLSFSSDKVQEENDEM